MPTHSGLGLRHKNLRRGGCDTNIQSIAPGVSSVLPLPGNSLQLFAEVSRLSGGPATA